MAATDVAPSRLEAAKKAATAFVDAQPSSVDIGVVAFQTGALTTDQPSADHTQAAAAIQRLQIAGGTSLSAAILTSLSAITGKTVVDRQGRHRPRHRLLGLGDDRAVRRRRRRRQRRRDDGRGHRGRRTPACTSRRSGSAPPPARRSRSTATGSQTALDEDTLTDHRQDDRRLVPPGVGRGRTRRHRHDDQPAADDPQRSAAAGRRVHRVRDRAARPRRDPHRPAHRTDRLMSFDWPWALLALAAIPLVLGIAWWSRRRRRRAAVRVTSAVLVRSALPGRTLWRRRIPAALLVLGLAVLGVGAARPQATVAVSSNSTTIMLALDVSGSMCSTDVAPNRINAAEKAAATFIKAQPHGTRMGLVAFAGVAAEIVPPTTDIEQAARRDEDPDHLARHRDRRGDPHLDRRDRRGRSVGAADRGEGDRRTPGRATPRRPSSCSPTGPTPRASTRRRRRSRRPTATFGCTRSASAPRRRRRWSATARRSPAAGASAAAGAAASATAAAATAASTR